MKKNKLGIISLTLVITLALILGSFTTISADEPETILNTAGEEVAFMPAPPILQYVPMLTELMEDVIAFDVSKGQSTFDVSDFIDDLIAEGYTVAWWWLDGETVIPENIMKLVLLGASQGTTLWEPYSSVEGDMLEAWVDDGGELMVLTEYGGMFTYYTEEACIPFGVTPRYDMVTDPIDYDTYPYWVIYQSDNFAPSHPIFTGVSAVEFQASCSLDTSSGEIIITDADANPDEEPVAVAMEYGDGRVAIFGDYDWLTNYHFTDEGYSKEDNAIMAMNTIYWLNGLFDVVEIEKHYTHTDVDFYPWHWEYIRFYEDFDSPAGWVPHAPGEWNLNTGTEKVTTGDSGIPELMLYWTDVVGSEAWIESPQVDTSIAEILTLEFDHMIDAWEFGTGGGNIHFYLWARAESTDPYSLIDEWHPGLVDMPSATENYDISAFIGPETQIVFQFLGDAAADLTGWYIDDVEVNGQYKVIDPAELGTPLESIEMVINHNKVKSHNPGQFYAVIEITGPVQTFRFRDNFDVEFDVHPSKVGAGGVQAVAIDPDGYAIDISQYVEIKKINNGKNFVRINFNLPIELPPGYTIMVYIKFQTAYKNKPYGGNNWFWDNAKIDFEGDSGWDLETGRVRLRVYH
jgi:hypothetical protein